MKVNDRVWKHQFLILGLVLVILNSCIKEKSLSLPELSTIPLSGITSTSVISGGNVSSDGGSTIVARGMCWSTNIDPTVSDNITSDGTGAGSFSSSVSGLTSGVDYYMRAYATNKEGTSYGNEFLFILPLTDIDGNVYQTVLIGNQAWIRMNLKTTRFSDSTPIPQVTDNTAWSSLSSAAFCWYTNDKSNNISNYGALYNWYAVNSGKLCPAGWHVPSEKEWNTLSEYLGGESLAGGKLKESGEDHWYSPNLGASDDYGFTALPGGYRTGLSTGNFRARGFAGWWWASTEDTVISARGRLIFFDASELVPGSGLKTNGYAVRCVKD